MATGGFSLFGRSIFTQRYQIVIADRSPRLAIPGRCALFGAWRESQRLFGSIQNRMASLNSALKSGMVEFYNCPLVELLPGRTRRYSTR